MEGQTLRDISNGSDWIIYVVVVVLAIMAITLLLGKGAWMIAGYNTATKEEKEKYNEKALCRVVGAGLALIAVLALIMGIFQDVLPASFATVSLVVILVDVVAILVLGNTVCRKK